MSLHKFRFFRFLQGNLHAQDCKFDPSITAKLKHSIYFRMSTKRPRKKNWRIANLEKAKLAQKRKSAMSALHEEIGDRFQPFNEEVYDTPTSSKRLKESVVRDEIDNFVAAIEETDIVSAFSDFYRNEQSFSKFGRMGTISLRC